MPQPFRNAVITDGGANLLTRAQAGETKIKFTRIAVGNGTYTQEEKELAPMQVLQALKAEKNSYPVSDLEVQTDHSVKVTALITNMEQQTHKNLVEQGYYINEIGLFARLSDDSDTEEILYSIAVTAGEHGDFMPPYNGIFPCRITQDWIIAVDNAANVTVEYIDGTRSVTFATHEEVKTAIDEALGESGEEEGGGTSAGEYATESEVQAIKDSLFNW